MQSLTSLLVLLQLGGCYGAGAVSPREQQWSPDARLDGNRFITTDGTALPFERWGDIAQPNVVVVAVHGMNDYHLAFAPVAGTFADAGIVTYAYDQRGHGGAPNAGQWAGYAVMAGDLVAFLRLVRQRHPHSAIILLGESMGGAISVLAATDLKAPHLQGLILSSPAIKPSTSTRKPVRIATQLAGALLPDVTFPTPPTMSSKMTDNKVVLKQMSTDPMIPRSISVGTLTGVGAAMEAAADAVAAVRVPTLLLMGEKDPILSTANRELLMGYLKGVIPDLSVTVYPDGHHLLLRDLQAARVYERILDWIGSTAHS